MYFKHMESTEIDEMRIICLVHVTKRRRLPESMSDHVLLTHGICQNRRNAIQLLINGLIFAIQFCH